MACPLPATVKLAVGASRSQVALAGGDRRSWVALAEGEGCHQVLGGPGSR